MDFNNDESAGTEDTNKILERHEFYLQKWNERNGISNTRTLCFIPISNEIFIKLNYCSSLIKFSQL